MVLLKKQTLNLPTDIVLCPQQHNVGEMVNYNSTQGNPFFYVNNLIVVLIVLVYIDYCSLKQNKVSVFDLLSKFVICHLQTYFYSAHQMASNNFQTSQPIL